MDLINEMQKNFNYKVSDEDIEIKREEESRWKKRYMGFNSFLQSENELIEKK